MQWRREKGRSPEKHSAAVGDQARSASPQVFIHFPMQETRVAGDASSGRIHKPQPNRQERKRDAESNGWERRTRLQFGIRQNSYSFKVEACLQDESLGSQQPWEDYSRMCKKPIYLAVFPSPPSPPHTLHQVYVPRYEYMCVYVCLSLWLRQDKWRKALLPQDFTGTPA